MRIRKYDGNSIHAPAQPFNRQNKASEIIFVDLRKISESAPKDPHPPFDPPCAQKLKQNCRLLLMIDLKYRATGKSKKCLEMMPLA